MKNNEFLRKAASFVLASTVVAGVPVAAHADTLPDGLTMEETYDDVFTYTVVEGDTLGGICERIYGDASLWELLAEFNHMKLPCQLWVGDKVAIPRVIKGNLNGYPLRAEAKTDGYTCTPVEEVVVDPEMRAPYVGEDTLYTVKEGDTMYCIVRVFYGLTSQEAVDKLATYNDLCDPNRIVAGQVLAIPSLEVLEQVVANDYTDEYNRMNWILTHPYVCRPCEPRPCRPRPCRPNPCEPNPCVPCEPEPCFVIEPCGKYVNILPAPDCSPYQYIIEYEDGCSQVLKLKY